jgi:hypothetical protein
LAPGSKFRAADEEASATLALTSAVRIGFARNGTNNLPGRPVSRSAIAPKNQRHSKGGEGDKRDDKGQAGIQRKEGGHFFLALRFY